MNSKLQETPVMKTKQQETPVMNTKLQESCRKLQFCKKLSNEH